MDAVTERAEQTGGRGDGRPAVRVEGRRVEVLWDGGARSPLEVP